MGELPGNKFARLSFSPNRPAAVRKGAAIRAVKREELRQISMAASKLRPVDGLRYE